MRGTSPFKLVFTLLIQMQDEDNHRQDSGRSDDSECHPRDPLTRAQVQLLPPRVAFHRRNDDDLRVRNHALHIDEMLGRVFRRANEQVLDVVVRSPEAEVHVRRQQRLVRRLWELRNWAGDTMRLCLNSQDKIAGLTFGC